MSLVRPCQEAEIGMSHIVINLMPARLATALVELFGYQGKRHLCLSLWQKAGGRTKEVTGAGCQSAMVRRRSHDIW
jgi:hypothetical protein